MTQHDSRVQEFSPLAVALRRGIIAWAPALAVVLGLLTPAVASAQWQMFALTDRPPVTERDPQLMQRVVGLDAAQVELVEALQDEAMAEFERIAEIMEGIQEDAREEAQAERDQSVWMDLFGKLREFAEYREEIREDFLENAELVLLPEQQEAWERFERRYFRQYTYQESATQYGSVAGVTVDVEEVVEAADLAPEEVQSVQSVLDQYSREVDRDLRALTEAVERNMEARIEAFRKMRDGEGWDMELMNTGMDRMAELVDSLRETNLRYERQIANQLSPEARREFQRTFNRNAFPRIYRDEVAASRFRTALQRDDLTDEQRQTLSELQAQYEREANAIRDRLRQAALEENPIERMQQGMGRWGGRDENDDNDDQEALDDLNERYVGQIDATLTPEQREDLRANDPTDWRNRTFNR